MSDETKVGEVKAVIASFGAEVKAVVDAKELDKLPQLTTDATLEVCQLFEPKVDVDVRELLAREILCQAWDGSRESAEETWDTNSSEIHKTPYYEEADVYLAIHQIALALKLYQEAQEAKQKGFEIAVVERDAPLPDKPNPITAEEHNAQVDMYKDGFTDKTVKYLEV